MWPDRRLCDLLQIEHPIIQAPMSGSATPALAAAVSNAGGLGSLGCAAMSAAELLNAVTELRAFTNRPFNLNFFVHPAPQMNAAVFQRTVKRLQTFYAELGLSPPEANQIPSTPGFDLQKLDVILDLCPPVVSFHFGLPDEVAVTALRAAGIVLLSSATTVSEARALVQGGADAIIAQGWEAGGHRGSHVPTEPIDGVGTMALVPQIVDAVDLPVIAAGGIADGRGVAAAFALVACGVQIGTGFLACPEAATDSARRSLLHSAKDTDTTVTDAYSGRSARALRTRYSAEMAKNREALLDFPSMYGLSGPLSEAALARGNVDFAFHLYGQAAALARKQPAGELVRCLVRETAEAFEYLSSPDVPRPGPNRCL
jgi:nitronate monooxygenase